MSQIQNVFTDREKTQFQNVFISPPKY